MRRGRLVGPMTYWMAIAVIVYAVLSGAVALGTLDKCKDTRLDRVWELIPPRWECRPHRVHFDFG